MGGRCGCWASTLTCVVRTSMRPLWDSCRGSYSNRSQKKRQQSSKTLGLLVCPTKALPNRPKRGGNPKRFLPKSPQAPSADEEETPNETGPKNPQTSLNMLIHNYISMVISPPATNRALTTRNRCGDDPTAWARTQRGRASMSRARCWEAADTELHKAESEKGWRDRTTEIAS